MQPASALVTNRTRRLSEYNLGKAVSANSKRFYFIDIQRLKLRLGFLLLLARRSIQQVFGGQFCDLKVFFSENISLAKQHLAQIQRRP